jgi:hypothetical protein
MLENTRGEKFLWRDINHFVFMEPQKLSSSGTLLYFVQFNNEITESRVEETDKINFIRQ